MGTESAAEAKYLLKSARYLAQEVLSRVIVPGDTVVDATAGNGHDTEFLCRLVGETGLVYAFDIQPEAAAATEKRLSEAGLDRRARVLLSGHEHMADFVEGPIAAAVFNLGWLPGGNHQITTRWETTRTAVEAALGLLGKDGVVTVCAYPGHEEGGRELKNLREALGALDNRKFNVLAQKFLNAGPGAPECFIIQKQG